MESLGGTGLPLGNLTSAQKDELMDRVRQEMALANAQELLAVSGPSDYDVHSIFQIEYVECKIGLTLNHKKVTFLMVFSFSGNVQEMFR